MRRLLVLSYHYAPFNSIGSQRALAFVEHLPAHGIHPVVLTHAWERMEGENWRIQIGGAVSRETHASHTVIRLPLPEGTTPYQEGSLHTFNRLLKGQFDLGGYLPASRAAYQAFLASPTNALDSIDAVLAIFNPHHHLELGAAWARKNRRPFCADLRDLWTADAGATPIHTDLKSRVRKHLMKRYWKRWLSDAALVSTVTEPWAQFMTSYLKRRVLTVRNGIEAGAFDTIEKQAMPTFTLVYTGKLYPEQELEPLAQALASLESHRAWQWVWVGAPSPDALTEVQRTFAAYGVNPDRIVGVPRVPRSEALSWLRSAHVAVYPTWPDVAGIVGGKVYEYLASGTEVIITARHEQLDVVQLTRACETGHVFFPNQQHELTQWLRTAHDAWVSQSTTKQPVNETPYLRQTQVGSWAKAFVQMMEKKSLEKSEAPVPASDASN